MKEVTISTYLTDGKVDIKVCQDGKKKWVELPQMKLKDDTDCDHLMGVIQQVNDFLSGDIKIEELDE